MNGVAVATGFALALRLRQPSDAFARQVTLPTDAVWMMRETPDSFDARYWGPLQIVQINLFWDQVGLGRRVVWIHADEGCQGRKKGAMMAP